MCTKLTTWIDDSAGICILSIYVSFVVRITCYMHILDSYHTSISEKNKSTGSCTNSILLAMYVEYEIACTYDVYAEYEYACVYMM